MLDLLRGVLSSLLVFLGAGMLLEAFIREEGKCGQLCRGRGSTLAQCVVCDIVGDAA